MATNEKSSLLKDFKAFIMRGNILDLAVAVIIGIAFGALLKVFVDGVLMQLVAAIAGKPDFSALTFTIGKGVIRYGALVTEAINFLIIAATMFLVLRFVSRMQRPKEIDITAAAPSETELLTEIRDLLAAQQRTHA